MAVEPAALAGWSTDAGRARIRLAAMVGEADAAVAEMGSSWDGDAALRFAEHYREWRGHAERTLATLAALRSFIDTAHDAYAAAATTNREMWGSSSAGPAVVSPASTGTAGELGIDAEVEDVRATVSALRRATGAMVDGVATLSAALGTTATMSGNSAEGLVFGRDHDHMATVTWQALSTAANLLTAVSAALAETGNNILRADHDATPGRAEPLQLIPAATSPVPAPPGPPSAAGDNGSSALGHLLPYWPAADPVRLRVAESAWLAARASVRDAAMTVSNAVAALAGANPDPVLAQMQTFTDQYVGGGSRPTLFATLAVTCGRLAEACRLLADSTERTRLAMRDAVVEAISGEQWFDPVASVLDAAITRGAARLVALGGDLLFLDMRLNELSRDHQQRVRLLLGELAPAAADHLADLAVAVRPPVPLSSASTAGSPAHAIAGGAMLGPGVRTVGGQALAVTRAQIEKKYDAHAAAFGVPAPRSADGFVQLEAHLKAFIIAPDTLHIDGTYRGQPVIMNVNPYDHRIVLQAWSGEFLSGWILNVDQEWNVVNRGSL